MKKVLKTLAVLVVLAAAGFFGYRYYQSRQAVAAQTTDGSIYDHGWQHLYGIYRNHRVPFQDGHRYGHAVHQPDR